VSHMTVLAQCPLCQRPILVGHSIRIIREVASDENSKTVTTHYNCDEPTLIPMKPQRPIVLSKGGNH
jgi:hypothetical protein